MALLWIDGFDHSISATTHNRVYASFDAGAGGVVNQQGIFNANLGRSLGLSSAVFTTKPLVAVAVDTLIIGFGFRGGHSTGAVNSGDIPFISVSNSTGQQLRMEFLQADDPNGKPGGQYYKLRIVRGVTTLATSVQSFCSLPDASHWVYFEWKVVVDNVAGSFVVNYYIPRSRFSGTVTWDAANTGLDTREQSTEDIDRVTFEMVTGGASSFYVVLDDIYICDTSGAVNNDFLGPVMVQHQKPTAAGATQDWVVLGAANVQTALAESVTGAPDDNSRVTSVTATEICLVTVGALATAIGDQTIHGVRQDFHGRMDAGSDSDVTHFYRKTTTTAAQVAGATKNVAGSSYAGFTEIRETDPNTTVAWVLADVTSYQHGFRNDG